MIYREQVRVLDAGAEAALHAGSHTGGADVDHHGCSEPGDRLEQWVQSAVVDLVAAHDRVEVEGQDAEFGDRALRLVDRRLALERVHRAPGVDDPVRVLRAQVGDVVVGARRRADDGLDVEGDQDHLDPGRGELVDDLFRGLRSPLPAPVLAEGLDEAPCESIQGWVPGWAWRSIRRPASPRWFGGPCDGGHGPVPGLP